MTVVPSFVCVTAMSVEPGSPARVEVALEPDLVAPGTVVVTARHLAHAGGSYGRMW